MHGLSICAKWTAAILAVLISPIVLIFVAPFAAGMAEDMTGAAGTPAALALTVAVALASLAWVWLRGASAQRSPRDPLRSRSRSIAAPAPPISGRQTPR
jgi:hypothetical protein